MSAWREGWRWDGTGPDLGKRDIVKALLIEEFAGTEDDAVADCSAMSCGIRHGLSKDESIALNAACRRGKILC